MHIISEMKEEKGMQYEKPKLELVNQDLEDVICTSVPTPPDYSWSGDDDGGFN